MIRRSRRCALLAASVGLGAALALGGCGGGGASDPGRQASTRTAPVSAPATGGTTTSATDVGRTSASAPTLPGTGKPTVLLGDMNTPEQFVLGQLYAYALRARGYTVSVTRNIGVPSVTDQAMHQGTLDVYPAYLSDFDRQVAHDRRRHRTEAAALAAARAYAARHHLVLLKATPFSNVSGLAVSSSFAADNHVHSLAQLARGPLVIVGAPLEYSHLTTGLPALTSAYGLQPAYVAPIAIGAQYAALDDNMCQAVYAQSTDPQLDGGRYTMLSDPRHASGIGNVVPVTTDRVLAAEGPAFAATLNQVNALLTLRAIRGLNAEVQLDHANPGLVATEFLQANGLMPSTTP